MLFIFIIVFIFILFDNFVFCFQKKYITPSENTSPNIQSDLTKVNNIASIIAKDDQASMEITSARKSCQKINGLKKNDTNNDPLNTNEQENGTNSGHSSSNESNNIDKRKKGILFNRGLQRY